MSLSESQLNELKSRISPLPEGLSDEQLAAFAEERLGMTNDGSVTVDAASWEAQSQYILTSSVAKNSASRLFRFKSWDKNHPRLFGVGLTQLTFVDANNPSRVFKNNSAPYFTFTANDQKGDYRVAILAEIRTTTTGYQLNCTCWTKPFIEGKNFSDTFQYDQENSPSIAIFDAGIIRVAEKYSGDSTAVNAVMFLQLNTLSGTIPLSYSVDAFNLYHSWLDKKLQSLRIGEAYVQYYGNTETTHIKQKCFTANNSDTLIFGSYARQEGNQLSYRSLNDDPPENGQSVECAITVNLHRKSNSTYCLPVALGRELAERNRWFAMPGVISIVRPSADSKRRFRIMEQTNFHGQPVSSASSADFINTTRIPDPFREDSEVMEQLDPYRIRLKSFRMLVNVSQKTYDAKVAKRKAVLGVEELDDDELWTIRTQSGTRIHSQKLQGYDVNFFSQLPLLEGQQTVNGEFYLAFRSVQRRTETFRDIIRCTGTMQSIIRKNRDDCFLLPLIRLQLHDGVIMECEWVAGALRDRILDVGARLNELYNWTIYDDETGTITVERVNVDSGQNIQKNETVATPLELEVEEPSSSSESSSSSSEETSSSSSQSSSSSSSSDEQSHLIPEESSSADANAAGIYVDHAGNALIITQAQQEELTGTEYFDNATQKVSNIKSENGQVTTVNNSGATSTAVQFKPIGEAWKPYVSGLDKIVFPGGQLRIFTGAITFKSFEIPPQEFTISKKGYLALVEKGEDFDDGYELKVFNDGVQSAVNIVTIAKWDVKKVGVSGIAIKDFDTESTVAMETKFINSPTTYKSIYDSQYNQNLSHPKVTFRTMSAHLVLYHAPLNYSQASLNSESVSCVRTSISHNTYVINNGKNLRWKTGHVVVMEDGTNSRRVRINEFTPGTLAIVPQRIEGNNIVCRIHFFPRSEGQNPAGSSPPMQTNASTSGNSVQSYQNLSFYHRVPDWCLPIMRIEPRSGWFNSLINYEYEFCFTKPVKDTAELKPFIVGPNTVWVSPGTLVRNNGEGTRKFPGQSIQFNPYQQNQYWFYGQVLWYPYDNGVLHAGFRGINTPYEFKSELVQTVVFGRIPSFSENNGISICFFHDILTRNNYPSEPTYLPMQNHMYLKSKQVFGSNGSFVYNAAKESQPYLEIALSGTTKIVVKANGKAIKNVTMPAFSFTFSPENINKYTKEPTTSNIQYNTIMLVAVIPQSGNPEWLPTDSNTLNTLVKQSKTNGALILRTFDIRVMRYNEKYYYKSTWPAGGGLLEIQVYPSSSNGIQISRTTIGKDKKVTQQTLTYTMS